MPYTEMQAGIPVTTIPSDEQLSAAAERVKLDLLLRSLQPPEMETQIAQGWTAAELNRTVKQYEAQGWQVAPASSPWWCCRIVEAGRPPSTGKRRD